MTGWLGVVVVPDGSGQGEDALQDPAAGNMIKAVGLNALAGQTLKSFTAKVTAHALKEVGDLIESGHITPVIDCA